VWFVWLVIKMRTLEFQLVFEETLTPEQEIEAHRILRLMVKHDPNAELLPEGYSLPANETQYWDTFRRNALLKEWSETISKYTNSKTQVVITWVQR